MARGLIASEEGAQGKQQVENVVRMIIGLRRRFSDFVEENSEPYGFGDFDEDKD